MKNGNNFPVFDPAAIEAAEEQARRDREEALKIYPHIQNAIAWLERASGASREARERLQDKIEEAKKFLQAHRQHEVPAIRRAVWRAILGFELTRPIDTRSEVEALLADLVKRGLFQETSDGYLRAYGKSYQLHPESKFGEPEKAEVKALLRDLLNRVKEGFLASTTITLEELFNGKAGECAVEIPPEKVEQNGKELWLGGGVLRVKSNGEYIEPLEAMGAIEGAIREARELNVKLLVKSLKSSQPPFVTGLDAKRGGKVRLLWRLLKRAKRLAEEKKTFPTRATVTPEEFFLERKPGICLVDFAPDVWEVKDEEGKVVNRIHSMFLLVERREEEGTKRIHVVEVPNHLVGFFAPCLGEEYNEEGNRFEGCPQPLRAVLQAMYGRVYKASRDAEKAGQIIVNALK